MKKLLVFLFTFILCVSMTGCSSSTDTDKAGSGTMEEVTQSPEAEPSASPVSVRVGVLKGPTAMGMVKLMSDSDSDAIEPDTNQYTFTIGASVDEISPAFIKGDLDIAAVPANLASVLYNKMDKNVEVLAINTLGILYICEKGNNSINSVEDLKGKTIYASGKGATPEYALDYILEKNGLDPDKDVTIEWKTEHSECVSALVKNEDAVALLPEPFVTVAEQTDSEIHAALDLTDEWDKIQVLQGDQEETSALLTGVVIARKDFIESNPEAVNLFMDQYNESVDYVNENIDEAAKLIEQYDIVKSDVAKAALPNCNITFLEGSDLKEKLSGYLQVLYEENPEAVGGTLPDDAFYYSR